MTVAEAPTRKPRKTKPEFSAGDARNAAGQAIALDESGRLTDVPVNWTRDYAPLKKGSFKTKELYVKWRQYLIDEQIKKLQTKKTELLDSLRDLGPKEKARKRLAKLREQMAALEAQLEG